MIGSRKASASSRDGLREFAPALFLIGLASCGTSRQNAAASLALSSEAFRNGQAIPAQYGCDGADQSPPLSWSEPPKGTRGFALVIDDPDAPGGIFRHWAVFDISAGTRSLAAGRPVGSEAVNDFGKPGYGGPCPPRGHGPHHYHFRLFAVNSTALGLPAGTKAAAVEDAASRHAIAQGELIGIYERK